MLIRQHSIVERAEQGAAYRIFKWQERDGTAVEGQAFVWEMTLGLVAAPLVLPLLCGDVGAIFVFGAAHVALLSTKCHVTCMYYTLRNVYAWWLAV